MNPSPARQRDGLDQTILALGRADPLIVAVDADYGRPTRETPFSKEFPDRFFDVSTSDPNTVGTSARLAGEGRTVIATGLASLIAGQGYDRVRESVCRPKARVRFLADPTIPLPEEVGPSGPMAEDIGLMVGLPGMTVLCPADPPSASSALRASVGIDGPAYLRLGPDDAPTVTDGIVEIGRARELRAGQDLTIVAVGAAVGRALETATALARVGISARVLDLASVKPIDGQALLRAARETGAILSLEEHSALRGVGSLVAAYTSEEYPVPVRRIGSPDLFPEVPEEGASDPYGLSLEHCLEEAYELLRARGKVQ